MSRRGAETVVDTLRQEGLARCSRPLPDRAGAVRLVTSQLGPGFVRGDRFVTEGFVGAEAELVVVTQAAARALGAGASSLAASTWHVADRATLRLLGEPLAAYSEARHRSTLEVALAGSATFAYLDVLVAAEAFASLETRLRVLHDGRLLVHDALSLSPAHLEEAIGTALYLCPNRSEDERTIQRERVDRAADAAFRAYGVTIGSGTARGAGIVIRSRGPSASLVRAALVDILSAAEA